MKIFAHNNCLNDPKEFGSFTVVARKLNEYLKKLSVFGDPNSKDTYVLYPEVYATEQRWHRHIPYLACEYSLAPQIVIDKLKAYNPLVFSISNFAKNNLINSGYNKVETVHLGTDSNLWYNTNVSKFETFTYLTVNTSNERSGFEKLIPAFIEFSKDKNVNLIIKDGNNPNFKSYIKSLDCDKIKYINNMLTEDQLRELYNRSHLFLYTNNTTSFGMNPLDSVLCGTPCIVTLGSALKEFIPEWTQPVKVKTQFHQITPQSVLDWQSIGISCFPPEFLSLFSGPIYGERVIQENILEALEFSFNNYEEYINISKHHKDYILNNFTWEICVNNLINKVTDYDKSFS